MQIIALPFLQLPYGIVERGPQRKEREMKGKKIKKEKKKEKGVCVCVRNETTSR